MNQIENKLNNIKYNQVADTSAAAQFSNNQKKIFQENNFYSMNNRNVGSMAQSINHSAVRDSNINQNSSIALYENLEQPLSEIFFWKIKEFVKEKFETALFAKTSLEQISEITIKIAEDLIMIKEKLVPIFPPKYNIFDRYFMEYQEIIFNTLYPFVKDENEKYLEENKGDLIVLAKWLDKYETILRRIGIDVNQCEIAAVTFFFI